MATDAITGGPAGQRPLPLSGNQPAALNQTTQDAAAAMAAMLATGVLGTQGTGQQQAQALQAGQQLASAPASGVKPTLPAFDADLAQLDPGEADKLIEMLTLQLNAEMMKTMSTGIKANQDQSKKASEERLKALEESTKKAKEALAKENSFFGRLFKAASQLFSLVGAALTIMAGVALAPTGIGVALIAVGVLTAVNTAIDIASDIKVAMGGEPITFRLSLGSLVAAGLEKLGVDEKTAKMIGAGVDLAAAIAVVAVTWGAGASAALNNISSALRTIKAVTTVGSIVSNVGNTVNKMQIEQIKYDGALADAQAERLKADMARFAKFMQQNIEALKELRGLNDETVEGISNSIKSRAEAGQAVAANMRVAG